MARASFSNSSAMVDLNGSSLLTRDRVAGVCAGVSKYFLMVCQLMRRCCSILQNGPVLDPIQVMQIVDLIGGEHSPLPFMGQAATL